MGFVWLAVGIFVIIGFVGGRSHKRTRILYMQTLEALKKNPTSVELRQQAWMLGRRVYFIKDATIGHNEKIVQQNMMREQRLRNEIDAITLGR